MNIFVTPLTELYADELRCVAALHCAEMPTLLTDLGPSAVQRYYEAAVRDPQAIGFAILALDDRQLLGWILGSPHPTELAAQLRESPLWFAGQLARLALTRPFVLVQFVRAVLSPAAENAIQPSEIELTYIGIVKPARGQGLGMLMMQKFLSACAEAGYSRVSLSVETDNLAAIRLYRQVGFEKVKEFQEGKYHRLRMSLAMPK